MSFSKKILVGLLTGIATGIVLGEDVAPLTLVAEGLVRLLQMTVLPYVTVSIVLGHDEPAGGAQASLSAGGGLLGMLAPMLDANRDGSMVNDVIGMLGRFTKS